MTDTDTDTDTVAPGAADRGQVNKVVLAYSGGLDTSIILRWLTETYDCEVVTFTADLGQGEEVEPARTKAIAMGVPESSIFIEDLREEFVRDFVFPMFRANTIYEGEYLLGTSIARPLIAKRLVEIARETGADAISHGATGKGNDQVRFELGAYALEPEIRVIAPWREWDLGSRESLMRYAAEHDIPIEMKRGKESPFSMDANLLHISYEGGPLEDPWTEPPKEMWRWSVSPEDAPNEARYVDLTYAGGDIVAIDGQAMSPAEVLTELNRLGGAHGVGRLDIVENRYVGMKSPWRVRDPGRHHHVAGAPGDRVPHARSRGRPPQGRPHAPLREPHLQRLLVEPRADHAAGRDRPQPGLGQRRGTRQALQGQRRRGRSPERRLVVRRADRHLRRGRGRLRPGRCRGLHQAQRAPPA